MLVDNCKAILILGNKLITKIIAKLNVSNAVISEIKWR